MRIRWGGAGGGASGPGPNDVQLLFEYASENFVYVVLLKEWSAIVRGVETTEKSARTDRKSDLPSQTALMAAAARAAHLIVDREPVIFADELAATLLGEQADEFISYHRAHGTHLVLSCARAQVLCRSRFTEDHLAACVRSGLTQYVILGAGLDSFAYRTESAGPGLRGRSPRHPAVETRAARGGRDPGAGQRELRGHGLRARPAGRPAAARRGSTRPGQRWSAGSA